MSVNVPLGVRIFNAPTSFDMWVTQNVEDFTFRSGVPGGFLDASIRFRRYAPIGQPDVTIWTPATSAVSTDKTSFKIADANAAPIKVGDRFWVYNSSGAIRMNGDRFTVTGKSSSGGTTTVTYAPSSSALIAAGDTVTAKIPASFYDTSLLGFNKMLALFNRVQIVDLRTAEIAWEGRIEQPARESEKDLWTLGVLGSSVFATDITRPMYYLDDQAESWVDEPFFDTGYTETIESDKLQIKFTDGWPWIATYPDYGYMYRRIYFQKSDSLTIPIGRFDAIANGNDDVDLAGKLGITLRGQAMDGGFYSTPVDQNNIAGYKLNGTPDFHFNKVVGTHIYYPTDRLWMAGGYLATSGGEATSGKQAWGSWTYPRVQALRMDRFRTQLNTGASYPDGALRVYQVVEDVLGRFLNGGHDANYADIPYWGYVDPYTAYVDNSSTVLMVGGWTFYDGTTAKEILDKICSEAQPSAYWAIWESSFNNTDSGFNSKCKFEFVNWPAGWGYSLTSEDGFSEQPDGSGEYTYVYYQYSWSDPAEKGSTHHYGYWNTNLNSDLDRANITRSVFLKRDQSLEDFSPAQDEIEDFMENQASRVKNSGTIKIGRPVLVYDPGIGRPNGLARMMDPWLIRPGKLGKVMDLEPKANINDFGYGATAPTRETDGTIFRMVNTEYSSQTNTVTIDLDQNASWNIPNQFITPKPGKFHIGTYYH